jgi:hypothetical protein
MARDMDILKEAATTAVRKKDKRSYFLCAIARRKDGTMVRAVNGPAEKPTPEIHAEARLSQKLDVGAEVWVVRTTQNGQWGLAKPCPHCEVALRRRGVRRLVYSTGPDTFDVRVF